MKRNKIRIWVGVMTFSLLGLLALQGYWVHNAIQLKEKEFDQNVRRALHQVVNQIETYEASHYLMHDFQQRFGMPGVLILDADTARMMQPGLNGFRYSSSFTQVSPNSRLEIQVEENLIGNAPGHPPKTPEEGIVPISHTSKTGRKNDRLIEWKIGSQDPQSFTTDTGKSSVSINIQSGAEEESIQVISSGEQNEWMLAKIRDSIMKIHPHRMEFVDRVLVKMLRSPKAINERINLEAVDTLLKNVLADLGIKDHYWFEVRHKSPRNVTFASSGQEESPDAKAYTVKLFPNDIRDSQGYLSVSFPDRKTGLWQAVGVILPTSGILVLLVMLSFGMIVFAMNRQKKLSDMKTDFINNMTHELKTPISTISLATEALADPDMISSQSGVNHFSRIIKEENNRLKAHVERVLQIAAIDRGDFRLKVSEVDLHEILQKEIERIDGRLQEKNGKISLSLGATTTKIAGDPVHLAGIFANLLDNALKYSPENPQISVQTANEKSGMSIRIKDKGIGMSKEAQGKVFEKFYRVPTGNLHDVKGFGLGLNYVKSMVEAHGGTITLKSEPSKGSEFDVYLPLKNQLL